MNRREFGKRSAGMIAVACLWRHKPKRVPRMGDSVKVNYYGLAFESYVGDTADIVSRDYTGPAYHVPLPNSVRPEDKMRWRLCYSDQIEVIA